MSEESAKHAAVGVGFASEASGPHPLPTQVFCFALACSSLAILSACSKIEYKYENKNTAVNSQGMSENSDKQNTPMLTLRQELSKEIHGGTEVLVQMNSLNSFKNGLSLS